MPWWTGPDSGARSGAKEYREQTRVPRGKTNSHWKAEEKNDKKAARKQRRREKAAEKEPTKNGGWFR